MTTLTKRQQTDLVQVDGTRQLAILADFLRPRSTIRIDEGDLLAGVWRSGEHTVEFIINLTDPSRVRGFSGGKCTQLDELIPAQAFRVGVSVMRGPSVASYMSIGPKDDVVATFLAVMESIFLHPQLLPYDLKQKLLR